MNEKSIGIIISFIAGLVLVHYLLKLKNKKENEIKNTIPVDRYGVGIEPNLVQYQDVMLDIQSIT